MMIALLTENISSTDAASSLPPLPSVPEPPIFDASYYVQLLAVLNDSYFPPTMSAHEIYDVRLRVVNGIVAGRKQSSQTLSINLMATWVSMVIMCGFLLVRIRRNRQRALSGDSVAARNIVLPAFEPLLWLLGGANVTFIVGYGALLLMKDCVVNHNRFTMELVVAVKMMNALLVPVYMLQPSISARALRRAVGQTLVLSMYTVPVIVVLNHFATRENQRRCYWTLMSSRFLVGVYLLYFVVYPPARASVWSFRLFCIYIISLVLMMYWMAEVYHRGHTGRTSVIAWVITSHAMLLPLFVWCVLRADTEHWRGIGKRAVELQETFRRKNGNIDEHVSSEGLHVLIEMHRRYIIDFARLQVREPISEVTKGSRAGTVYRGFLHTSKTPVAIKVYMPTDFTEETVAEFSHEAALCGALVHPNILKFHGLCVCPPNICLVTELCQRSLQDVIDAKAARHRQGNSTTCRQQSLIDLCYMVDAARAIAYLHSFSPPFLHCDIKPNSFLVDDEGTVKLTDFGASRTLAVRSQSPETEQHTRRTVLEIAGVAYNTEAIDYSAPEVLRAHGAGSHIYGEAADIYSLAITMWDVLHPGKFKHTPSIRSTRASVRDHDGQRESEVVALIVAGERPPMNPLVPSTLRELIQAAWHPDPRLRPTAAALVASLEAIQEELSASFVLELMHEMNGDSSDGMTILGVGSQPSFPGAKAVRVLNSSNHVGSRSSAIRLGNMLMDCGFLHHTKHIRAFTDGGFHYVFDAGQVFACQPLTLLEPPPSGHDNPSHGGGVFDGSGCIHEFRKSQLSAGSSLDVFVSGYPRIGSRTSSQGAPERRCACRKLGQRMETQLTTQRRFRLNFRAFTSENLLTAKLLADDDQFHSGGPFAALGEPSNYHERHKTGEERSDTWLEVV